MPKRKQMHYLEMIKMTVRKCLASALKARGIQSDMFLYNRVEEQTNS